MQRYFSIPTTREWCWSKWSYGLSNTEGWNNKYLDKWDIKMERSRAALQTENLPHIFLCNVLYQNFHSCHLVCGHWCNGWDPHSSLRQSVRHIFHIAYFNVLRCRRDRCRTGTVSWLWRLNSLPFNAHAQTQPTLVRAGQILSTGRDFTINGPFPAAIAYLQTGSYFDFPIIIFLPTHDVDNNN